MIASAQPGFAEGAALARDGELVRFRVFDPAASELSGAAPMLLYNGLVSSSAHWPFFVRHFATRRRVVFWDYRGHGGHPPPRDLDTVTVEEFAEDAHTVARATLREPAIGVALSFGVQVALEHWRRHPGDLRALVLICGTDGHPLERVSGSPRLRKLAGALMRRFAGGGRVAKMALSAGRLGLARELAYLSGGAHREACPREVLDGVFHHTAAMDPSVAGRVVASYFEHSAREVLPTVSVPALVMAGDKDELTPVACAERMQRAIPDARLVVYPGHSHLVQVERPDDVHAEIDHFLDEKQL